MKKLLGLFSFLIPILSFADVPCGYSGKREQSIEFYKSCGQIKGDQIQLHDWHKENIIFEDNGLACILVGGEKAFYINQKGITRRTVFFDNGCDYFEDGLARGYENGKMVYIDKKLNVILKPDFEWLVPFDYEHAIVCNGPFETIKEGEHTWQTKGQCGLIDKKGKLVVGAKYPIGDGEAFDNYINSHNHCTKPPIKTKQSAICHAKRHLQHQETHKDMKKILSATESGDKWLVNFIYEDENQGEFVIELEAKTAGWLSIVSVEK